MMGGVDPAAVQRVRYGPYEDEDECPPLSMPDVGARAQASGFSQAGPSHTTRAQLPQIHRWELADGHTRNPRMFLSDVMSWASVARQDPGFALRQFVCKDLREALEAAEAHLVHERGFWSWEDRCKYFLQLINHDLISPEEGAAAVSCVQDKLLKQGSDDVQVYSTRVNCVASRVMGILPEQTVCNAFVAGLRNYLKPECMMPPGGGVWKNLHECIRHARSVEKKICKFGNSSGPQFWPFIPCCECHAGDQGT